MSVCRPVAPNAAEPGFCQSVTDLFSTTKPAKQTSSAIRAGLFEAVVLQPENGRSMWEVRWRDWVAQSGRYASTRDDEPWAVTRPLTARRRGQESAVFEIGIARSPDPLEAAAIGKADCDMLWIHNAHLE